MQSLDLASQNAVQLVRALLADEHYDPDAGISLKDLSAAASLTLGR